VLLSGRCEVLDTNTEGKELFVAELKEGDVFGDPVLPDGTDSYAGRGSVAVANRSFLLDQFDPLPRRSEPLKSAGPRMPRKRLFGRGRDLGGLRELTRFHEGGISEDWSISCEKVYLKSFPLPMLQLSPQARKHKLREIVEV